MISVGVLRGVDVTVGVGVLVRVGLPVGLAVGVCRSRHSPRKRAGLYEQSGHRDKNKFPHLQSHICNDTTDAGRFSFLIYDNVIVQQEKAGYHAQYDVVEWTHVQR